MKFKIKKQLLNEEILDEKITESKNRNKNKKKSREKKTANIEKHKAAQRIRNNNANKDSQQPTAAQKDRDQEEQENEKSDQENQEKIFELVNNVLRILDMDGFGTTIKARTTKKSWFGFGKETDVSEKEQKKYLDIGEKLLSNKPVLGKYLEILNNYIPQMDDGQKESIKSKFKHVLETLVALFDLNPNVYYIKQLLKPSAVQESKKYKLKLIENKRG